MQGVVIAEHAVKCAREHDLLRSFGRRISLPAECAQICDAPLGRGDVVVRREYAVVAAPDNQKRQDHRQRDERIDGRSSCPMKGFELHKVYYAGDKSSNSDSVLKWINELAKRDGWTDDFTEVIYFKSDFHTSKKEKDVENTGFDVDDEETGYGWYLARTEGGKWRIISSGY